MVGAGQVRAGTVETVNGMADRLVTFNETPSGGGSAAIRDSGAAAERGPGRRFRGVRKSNVALRVQESLLEEARRVSEREGVALNQFINVAVAEKLSALRTEDY